ncbi:MAG: ADP-glyceromanno-heptose 6-epimerase [Saprospiraceae bacterium]|nr:ADP-glyceromanno-heptose 6-epimerase [Saprospiraceae bacterium]
MIVVTGAYGFIGSYLTGRLNAMGLGQELVLVDDFNRPEKQSNLEHKKWRHQIDRNVFLSWLEVNARDISFVFHLGARTDTAETNESLFNELNLNYSKEGWKICSTYQIPMVYASSAATYGDGSFGFEDNEAEMAHLKPLNPYGWSKQRFDEWVLLQEATPPVWAGLKFFNVYGPNEYHKGRMASVIFHSFNKITASGKMYLIKSHKAGIEDGHQSRDFILVDDIASMCIQIMEKSGFKSGIYNAGTGQARTFLDLTINTFKAMGVEPNIEFIDTPVDIRDTYQYFTEAKMDKWKAIFPDALFTSLEEGVYQYVTQYLIYNKRY